MIQMLNSAGAVWGEFFLLAVIQNTIFLGLVFTALHLLRNAPARVRYLVALAGLIKLVLPPFLRIPPLPAIQEKAANGYGGLIPFVTGSPGGSATAASAAAEQGLTPAGALLGVWVLVVITGLVFSVTASVRLALRLRDARLIDDDEIPVLPGIEDVRILRSERIAMPITVAFLPGRVYVPVAWDGWTPSCRRMVLMHEMAHLKRHDGIVLIMQIIARAIYFSIHSSQSSTAGSPNTGRWPATMRRSEGTETPVWSIPGTWSKSLNPSYGVPPYAVRRPP